MINWQVLAFNQLSLEQLYQILKLRVDIFVVEQDCPYPDLDNLDQHCRHLFASEGDEILAYTRLIPPGLEHKGSVLDQQAAIGRVVVSEKARGRKLGYELMQRSIDAVWEATPAIPIKIGAQQHLEKFYGSLGFKTISEMYLEDGIPHIDMLLDPENN
ncbi:GNAT family N-acetyltransferase [Litoribrevibacter albus]|uniref:GNAT family N-acetyltransferase n=1 Tax=Litoribrevibacter albus TaxID=1473156 RepID=A0AA37W9N6_9GAMM|nr:GNAT family N-acetyltransferase [Litoribrevibacter albus]GLQ33554.1 GNAT family N-acetyltransferase [Litoribrevibacter albus]